MHSNIYLWYTWNVSKPNTYRFCYAVSKQLKHYSNKRQPQTDQNSPVRCPISKPKYVPGCSRHTYNSLFLQSSAAQHECKRLKATDRK
jgi:hypothetical protein